jgi:GDP-mannose transporter
MQIISSIIAAWPNISAYFFPPSSLALTPLAAAAATGSSGLGYFWVVTNCLVSAAYVSARARQIRRTRQSSRPTLTVMTLRSQILGMRKKIKSMGFTDWQTSFYNNAISFPVLIFASMLLEGWSGENFTKNL